MLGCSDAEFLETTRLGKDISKASRSLSIIVTKMKDNLDLFVSALEKVRVAVKNDGRTDPFAKRQKSAFPVDTP